MPTKIALKKASNSAVLIILKDIRSASCVRADLRTIAEWREVVATDFALLICSLEGKISSPVEIAGLARYNHE